METFDFTLPEITGIHTVYAVADPKNVIQEMSEANNESKTYLEVFDAHPDITVLSPDTNSVTHPVNIYSEASATDPMTGNIESDSSFKWSSDLDGELGTGRQLTVSQLSEGDHLITLEVTGPHGVSSAKNFNLYVRPKGTPLPKIKYPINGGHLSRELSYTLIGQAEDNEDGALTGTSLLWTSNIDGQLGSGNEIALQLSEGKHDLTLTATDSDGNENAMTIQVIVELGTPTLGITSPEAGAVITEGTEVSFEGTATDLQEGNISSRIIWSSNLDGMLDQSASFSKLLSTGNHQITAMIVDSDGLEASEEISISVQNTPPEVIITAPVSNTRVDFGQEVTFAGNATDFQDGSIAPENLTWSSDRDGYLGSGEGLTVGNLSVGWHVITLTAKDSKNLEGTATINLNIYVGIPTANILQPATNQEFKYGAIITLEGTATDDQDGSLTGASLVWTSDLDGALGTGALLSPNNLSLGTHTIRLEATDIDGWKGTAETTVIIKPPQKPQTSILFPSEGSKFEHGKLIGFYGRAMDSEDGNLTSTSIKWSSDVDGDIGTGSTLSINSLSLGTHRITMAATDSDGLTATNSVEIMVTLAPPNVIISEPAASTVIPVGETIILSGSGADTLSWSSNIDGELGTGTSISPPLSLGTHQLTLIGTDSYGTEGIATITITVADESSLSLNQFADGAISKTLDFETGDDYLLKLAIAKDAIVDSAQVTLHAQREIDTLQTLAVQSETPDETPQQSGETANQEWIDIDNLPQPEVVAPELASASGGGGEPVDLEENMGVMATNYVLYDHYMINVNQWNNPPKATYLVVGGIVNSWFKIVNLTEPGQIKWLFHKPDGSTHECLDSIGIGYAWWAAYCGINSPTAGQYYVEVFLKGISSPEWTHYYTESYFVHENPIIPPSPTINTNPVDAVIYEDSNIQLALKGNDNSERCTKREFHWNDGNSWQEDLDWGYFYCATNPVMKWVESAWDASSGFLDIGPYPEGTIVQYYGAVTDTEGNRVQTETKSFTVQDSDTECPAITNLTIEEGEGADMDGFVDETESIKITWQATDQSGIAEMLFHLNGGEQNVEIDRDLYTVQLGPQTLGEQSYIITATDADNSPETTIINDSFEVFRKPFVLNPSLDAADDGELDWNYEGEMEDDQITGSFASAINKYIGSNDPETDGKVLVPLRLRAEGGNKLRVQNLSLLYRITDVTPPTITDIMLTPESPFAGETISIGAIVYDNTGIKEVTADFGDNPMVMIGGENDSYSGSLVAPTAGEYSLTIKATDLSDLESESILPVITQYNGAELFVESVRFDPASPLLAGEEVTAQITLKNTGNQLAEAEVQISHVTIETQTIVIPAGDMATVTTTFTLPEAGEHSLQVEVDPNDLITEGDEANNNFTYSYQTTDSTPLSFEDSVLPKQVGAEQVFKVKVKLSDDENLESLTAQWLGQIYDFAADPDDWYSLSLTAPASLGTEPINLIARSKASLDSQVQKEIEIVDATPNPYVSANDISNASGNILALETPEFDISVHNNGGSDTTIPVQLKLDGAEVYQEDILIKANQITPIVWNGWQAVGGSHELTVILDPDNQVQELNESDNTAAYGFVVPYTLPPQLSNLQTTEDALENQTFEIAVNVLGDQRINSVTIDINGESHVMTSADGIKYAYSGMLPVGSYPFQINAINSSDLAARLPGTLVVHQNLADLVAQIPLITPVNLTNNDTAQFGITVRNDGYAAIGSVQVQIKLDGQELASEAISLSSKSEITLPMIEWEAVSGSHQLVVEVDPNSSVQESDELNNLSSLSFKVGNVNPPNIISVSAKEILYTSEVFTVEGQIEDQSPITVSAMLNGGNQNMTYDAQSEKHSVSLSAPTTVGDYSLKVIAQNADGLTSTWERAIIVLDSTPDLAIAPSDITITPRSLVEGQSETITALIHNYGGTDLTNAQVSLKISEIPLELKTIAVSKGASTLVIWEWLPDYGTNDIVIALDPNNAISESNENNNQYAASFFVSDITPPSTPQLSMAQVMSEQWSEVHDWRISWPEVEENNLKSYSYQIDGGIWIDTGLNREVELHFDIAGEHMVCVMAEDLAGNTSSTACTSILLDFEAPEAPVLMGGTNDHWSSDPLQSVIWSSPLDDGSGPKKYEVKINGQSSEVYDKNYFQQTWEDGQYAVQVSAIDALNHQSELSNKVQLQIDATAPASIQTISSSTHPDSESWYLNQNPVFDWDEPNDLSGVQGYYYHIDQNPDSAMNSRYLWAEENHISLAESEALSSGHWFLHVIAVDQAGNEGDETSHYEFKIDLDAPHTTVEQIMNNTVFLNAFDPHSGVKEVYYAIGGIDEIKPLAEPDYGYADFSWHNGSFISFPEPGNYQIYFYSEDNLGNKESIRSEVVQISVISKPIDNNSGGGGYSPPEEAYYRYLDTKDNEDEYELRAIGAFEALKKILMQFRNFKWKIR
ncbi:hypothetical protein KJ807_02405 [Patescibacteria group bacterium]|nr:hypothetical protein [Patescibacteria group bacterium]MBU1938960.1 hypothetical protein [Patescibacteria group bacterium]